jgi:OOP family OmpA-OmpF porin
MLRLARATLLVAFCFPVFGQDRAQNPSAEEMVQALMPKPKTRSLSPGNSTRNLMPTLDLTVNFDFDSARLRDDSKGRLRTLAAALGDPRLNGLRFRVEGHTDAQGTAAYNDQLSESRARAAVAFLASEGVDAGRLEPVGKGFRELLEPSDPKASLNRRVRILTLP